MATGASSATIANGASLSGAVDLTNFVFAGLMMPAAWTAASITFQGSIDGTTYGDLYNTSGTEYTIASANAVASRFIAIDPRDFAGVRYVKVRSGSSAAAVNQGAARTLGLALLS